MDSLIHPGMLAALRQFYPDACTIQEAVYTSDAAGQEHADWTDLAGHAGIACRVSPNGGSERKGVNQVYAVATHIINLAGYYPAIHEAHRAVVAGVAHDILLVEHDGQQASTRLVTQVVR